MEIVTCYTMDLKCQFKRTLELKKSKAAKQSKGTKKTQILQNTKKLKPKDALPVTKIQVSDALMKQTSCVCLEAFKYCADVFLSEWSFLSGLPATPQKDGLCRKSGAERLIHTTQDNTAKYPEFDKRFPMFPSYMRRAIISDALGCVSSYVFNHKNWEKEDPKTRGSKPTLGIPERYELTFYDQDRDNRFLSSGIIGLKLYDGKSWGWYYFGITASDARYLAKLLKTRTPASPTIEKIHGRYQIRFCFKENRTLVDDKNPLGYTVLGVDLGINAAASWCVMTGDGTVRGKGVIHLTCEEDRLNHLINRKRMYQQAGKKSRSIYRMVTGANKTLSIETTKAIIRIAERYHVDCIVFEHLDRNGKKPGRYKERIHMWRCNDIQKRVELQAHQRGMRISRVCAWGTSKYAFDGSGQVDRHVVYTWKHGVKRYNYSIAKFQNGKVYNCDISAAQNIAARYFLRELSKGETCPTLPSTPKRTYSTLRETTVISCIKAA